MKRLLPLLIIVAISLVGLGVWRHQKNSTTPLSSSQSSSAPLAQPKVKQVQNTVPAFDKSHYSTTNPDSPWVVVNKQRALDPLNYAPSDLTSVGNGQVMRKEAANALTKMFAEAASANVPLQALSGYRSYQTQVTVYGNEVKNYGQKVADTESARPGHSEHQTGWALDLGGGGCGIEDCFGNTAQGKWVAANAYKYGFIVRYTAAKQAVTGYRAEPWHIRYVGTYLSTQMHKQGISTLEEFFNL